MKNYDEKFISYALKIAKTHQGSTAPNPTVGCVIVKNGEILASGVTAKNGRPHAEKIAIDKISDKNILRGAEIYVTLEPCSHFGKTSPCADEIIKHGFQKVIIAIQDIDVRVNGNGIKKMRDAGIEVICGVKEKEAFEINRGFFYAKKTGLPFVTLKIASSLDGKVATKNFASKWITSEKARNFGHLLRAKNDAIIIGANTIRQDNPSLDCRLAGLEDFSPRIVVLSHSQNFSSNLKIFQSSQSPLILSGDTKQILEKLCAEGINSVLIEGGSNIATQFLQQNLVDELVWIRSKKIIGNDGIPAIGNLGFDSIESVLNNFQRSSIKEFEEESIEIFTKNNL